jgi:hypothetical protein
MMEELQDVVSKEKPSDERADGARGRGGLRQTVERYQAALEKQAVEESAVRAGVQEADGRFLGRPQVRRGAVVTAGEEITLPAGLASLDVEIPARGTVYRFTTPRGEMEIRARAMSRPLLANLELLGITALVVVAIWGIYGIVRREGFMDTYGRTLSTATIIAGLMSVVSGILPVAGLVVTMGGVVWKVHVARSWRRLAEPVG